LSAVTKFEKRNSGGASKKGGKQKSRSRKKATRKEPSPNFVRKRKNNKREGIPQGVPGETG